MRKKVLKKKSLKQVVKRGNPFWNKWIALSVFGLALVVWVGLAVLSYVSIEEEKAATIASLEPSTGGSMTINTLYDGDFEGDEAVFSDAGFGGKWERNKTYISNDNGGVGVVNVGFNSSKSLNIKTSTMNSRDYKEARQLINLPFDQEKAGRLSFNITDADLVSGPLNISVGVSVRLIFQDRNNQNLQETSIFPSEYCSTIETSSKGKKWGRMQGDFVVPIATAQVLLKISVSNLDASPNSKSMLFDNFKLETKINDPSVQFSSPGVGFKIITPKGKNYLKNGEMGLGWSGLWFGRGLDKG